MFFKKISYVIIGLMCSNAFALSPSLAEKKLEQSQLQPSSLWSMDLDLLFLRPALQRTNVYPELFGYSPYAQPTEVDGKNHWHQFSQRYKLGFKLGGQYQLNNITDLTLNWYHLNYLSQETLNTYKMRVHWDSLTGEAGKIVRVEGPISLRVHGGLEYSGFETRNKPGDRTQTNDVYHGIGPRVGLDINYQLIPQLKLYINGAGSILAGKADSIIYMGDYRIANYRHTLAYVPVLDSKLGVSYAPNFKFSNIKLDAGYMFKYYFDAANGHASTETSFSGFYLGFHWSGA